ncbi:MAG: hypothetical protein OXI96_00395 [Acidimicrobiaceae bacterium]|nr:hypothetical protein [Acidimicrobiaceae bacterium]
MRIVPSRSLGEAEFVAALALQQRLDRERDPGLPVTPAAELRAMFDNPVIDFAHHHRVVAFDGCARALAVGHLELTFDTANAKLATVEVTPADDAATIAVLTELLRIARADGRTSVIGWGDYSLERHIFWSGLGAELRYREQEASLDMTAVDPCLMQQWLGIGSTCVDIHLVRWARHCPEELIDVLVQTGNAINDAPIDTLEVADTIVDAAMLRAEIEERAACGLEYQGILAVTGDGAAVGATEVFVNRHRPACSWQWNTVVLPAYRRRGIARWMKAAMWRHLRETEPEVTMLHTGNAASNASMRNINTEMGFTPTHTTGFWQADLQVLLNAAV